MLIARVITRHTSIHRHTQRHTHLSKHIILVYRQTTVCKWVSTTRADSCSCLLSGCAALWQTGPFNPSWPLGSLHQVLGARFGWKQLSASSATPGGPQCSGKHGADVSLGFFGLSCSVEILSFAGRTPGDASVTPVSSARRLHLSSGCLRCHEDVTWPTPEKFLPLLFSNVLCVLLQVLKDRSPLLSWFCFVSTLLLQTANVIQ